MPDITMTPAEFEAYSSKLVDTTTKKVLEAVRLDRDGSGLGRPVGIGKAAGLGAGPMDGPIYAEAYRMLAIGSPRLALAVATGARLAPYLINVKAQFPSTDTIDVPEVGSDVKVVQDTLVDSLLVRVVNESATANLNQFQAQSDWFYNFQSGLEATLDVQGAPRYAIAPRFTLLATIADLVSGASHWPAGWLLTYQQQFLMSFHARVAIPFAPLSVHCTFRAWVPTGEAFVEMTNREALDRLASDAGIVVSDAYRARVLNR